MKNKTSKIPFRIIRYWLATPFIVSIVIPLIAFDLFLEIYHRVTFPLYGIPVNKRSKYVRIDRQKLSYLNVFDKAWCMYCGYANGFLSYTVKIAGDTEAYWCGIKHKEEGDYIPQPHQKEFLEYGDEITFKEKYPSKREK